MLIFNRSFMFQDLEIVRKIIKKLPNQEFYLTNKAFILIMAITLTIKPVSTL